MFGADDKDHLVQSHARAQELLLLYRPFNEAQLRGAGLDRFSGLRGVANRQADIETRMNSTKCDQVTWQPVARDSLACLNRQRAALKISKLAQSQFSSIDLCQDRSCFGKKHASGFGELDTTSYPIKELRIVARLQSGDGVAGRRLRQIKRSGSLGHMLALGDGDENTELLQRHGNALIYLKTRSY